MNIQLFLHIVAVDVNGFGTDSQLICDFSAGMAFSNHLENLTLPAGEV